MKIVFTAKDITKKGKEVIKTILKTKYFEEICYEWLEYKKEQIKESSYYNYKFQIEKNIIPYFECKNIIKMHNFSIYIDELSANLAPKTIRDITNILKGILNYYEETYNKKLKYKKIILPKIDKKEIEVFTARERQKIENYCLDQNTLRDLGIIIALNTGMRLGELCALKWENIDLTEKCIYIRQTAQRLYTGKGRKSKIIVGLPKTKCSIREIPINTKLYNILKPIKKNIKMMNFF